MLTGKSERRRKVAAHDEEESFVKHDDKLGHGLGNGLKGPAFVVAPLPAVASHVQQYVIVMSHVLFFRNE